MLMLGMSTSKKFVSVGKGRCQTANGFFRVRDNRRKQKLSLVITIPSHSILRKSSTSPASGVLFNGHY